MAKIVSAKQRNPGEKVFYCPRRSHTFSVPKIVDGKRLPLTNTVTGVPLSDINGNPQYREDTLRFIPYQDRLSEDGYWCTFVTNKDTPKEVVDYLVKCVEDRSSEITDEKGFLRITNPDLAQRVEQDKAKDDTIESMKGEIEKLRAQLQGKRQ